MKQFIFSGMPKLRFGAGVIGELAPLLLNLGADRVLVLTGAGSLDRSGIWPKISGMLSGLSVERVTVSGEPSPELVDGIVQEYRGPGRSGGKIDTVVAIGGGSVIDAGKAVAAMLTTEGSVLEYLEGVGDKHPPGTTLPFVAVPTTAGTGSEASKNAVISRVGESGFKKSLRHEAYMPAYAVVDPELTVSCPPFVTAASGLDAVTQLLEAYVSTGASMLTDSLCESGLRAAATGLPAAVQDGQDIEARSRMSYAAFLSGVVLAHAGLGIVHGAASPIGAFYPVPHGVVCGTLVGTATGKIITRLRELGSEEPLAKYARAGVLLSGIQAGNTGNLADGCDMLVEILGRWVDTFKMPLLGTYGIARSDLPRLADMSGLKNTPVDLGPGDIEDMLRSRL